MKKPIRLLLIGTGALVAALVLSSGLVLHSGVQTWAARKALASQPNLKATVGKVSAGFQTVELRDLRYEENGGVITLPVLTAEFSAIDAGLSKKFNLRRLVAKGWNLDLTHYAFPSALASPGAVGLPGTAAPAPALPPGAAVPVAAVAQVFQGIFAQAVLPFDLTLDGVELEGDVKLPPAAGLTSGTAHFVLKGGGLGVGREGSFTFTVTVALVGAELPVSSLTVTGRLGAAMDTPRTFSKLATQAEAAAKGPQFPKGVMLAADITASRTATGESYVIALSDSTRLLARLTGELPSATHRLDGTWKLDLRDADLLPFALGRPLPNFALVGEGGLSLDLTTTAIRATGKLDASAGKLDVIKPELAALGTVKVVSEFDLARQGEAVRVERLAATFSSAQPVATLQALQPFEFNARTGELKVADPTRDLLGLSLQALPLAWAQPWLKDIVATGGDLRGEFVAIARSGGFSLRPKAPLAVAGLSIARGGKPLVRSLDVSLTASADYTPQGWQMEVTPLVAQSGEITVLTLELKAGQLSGPGQPVKATGKFSADLPGLLAQPAASGVLLLTAGEARGDFVASIDAQQAIMAKLELSNLATDPKISKEKLPLLFLQLRADVAPNGVVSVNAPIALERDDRKSDLTLSGTLSPGKTAYAIDARVSSSFLAVDDVQVLTGLVPPKPAEPATRPAGAPPWAGLNGRLALDLKKVAYSDMLQVTDVTGLVTLEAGQAKLVDFRAGMGDGAEVTLNGDITFDAKGPAPYALAADLALDDFEPAPWFKALNPSQPATVDGKFSVASALGGRAPSLASLATAAHGDFQLVSKGGVFRGLPVSYAARVETSGKIAASAAAIGNMINSMTGRKDYADIANRAQAVAEVSKAIAAIPYDQLNVACSRDAALNTTLKDFTLISPEVRLSGGGLATYKPGAALLDQPVAMELKLRARGRIAELLRYLGKLEETTDDLGYAACTLPVKIGGTLRAPDTKELNAALANLALEKSGVSEKASELINKILGGSDLAYAPGRALGGLARSTVNFIAAPAGVRFIRTYSPLLRHPPPMSPPVAPMSRQPWLDNLRTAIIFLVVHMHACVTYSHVGDWYAMSAREPSLAEKLPFIVWQGHLQSFFMGLLFFLSGFFASGSLARRGPGAFVRERFVRLGLPALFYMLVVHPFILLGLNPWHANFGEPLAFYLKYLRTGRFVASSGPLWFAFALLIFCLVFALWRTLRPLPSHKLSPGESSPAAGGAAPSATAAPSAGALWIFAFALGAGTFLVRLVQPIGVNVLNMQLCFFVQYIAFFIAGLHAARVGWLPALVRSSLARRAGWLALIGGPVLMLAIMFFGGKGASDLSIFMGGWHWQALGMAVWEQLAGVGLSLGLLAFFSGRANRETPLLRWLSERSFCVYVLHAPVLVALFILYRSLPQNLWLLIALLTTTGLLVSFAAADLGRRIPGLRKIL